MGTDSYVEVGGHTTVHTYRLMSLSEIPLEELTPRTQPDLSRLIVDSNPQPY